MGARILLGYAKEEPDDDDSEFQGFWELVCHVVTKYHVLIPFRAFPFRLLMTLLEMCGNTKVRMYSNTRNVG